MVENPNIAAPVPLPEGPATEYARNFSTAMGGLSGGIAGAVLGAVWGMAGKSNMLLRSAVLAGVGAVTGIVLSGRTWANPPRIQPTGPVGDPDFAHDNAEAQAANDHVTKLIAERNAPQADIAQAL